MVGTWDERAIGPAADAHTGQLLAIYRTLAVGYALVTGGKVAEVPLRRLPLRCDETIGPISEGEGATVTVKTT
jgi:hypothetical protein